MVIVFFGADSKVGTTMLAQSTAEMIAGSREVLFLALNASVISAFADTDIKRIDFFSPEIQSRMRIEKSKITRAGGKKNLFIIGGADDDFKHEEFALDMIDIMVENLRRDFSDIVIDAGSDLKNVLSYSGVMKADMRVLVFSQNGHRIANKKPHIYLHPPTFSYIRRHIPPAHFREEIPLNTFRFAFDL